MDGKWPTKSQAAVTHIGRIPSTGMSPPARRNPKQVQMTRELLSGTFDLETTRWSNPRLCQDGEILSNRGSHRHEHLKVPANLQCKQRRPPRCQYNLSRFVRDQPSHCVFWYSERLPLDIPECIRSGSFLLLVQKSRIFSRTISGK